MLYTGNAPPYHITQPSTDYDVQIVPPTATMATLTCSLNVTIPRSMVVQWSRLHDNHQLSPDLGVKTGNTATLKIKDFQSSDVGFYQCLFNDVFGSGWILARNIRLQISIDALSKTEVQHMFTIMIRN